MDQVKPIIGTPIKFYAEYSVNNELDFGRAAGTENTTKNAILVSTLKSVTKQMVSENVDLVMTDIRTPPKIKSQIVHSQMQSLHTPGKGEAIPILLEGNDEAALEKISSDNIKYSNNDATPSSGLSTWILLNSDPTPFSQQKGQQKPTLYNISNLTTPENITDIKKKQKFPMRTNTESSIKNNTDGAVLGKKPERKPIATVQKVNQTHTKKPTSPKIDADTSSVQTTTSVTLQNSKFKNKMPVIVGKVPVSSSLKPELNTTTPMSFIESPSSPTDNGTRLGTPVVTYPHVPIRQRPYSTSSTRKSASASTSRPTLQSISTSVSPKIASDSANYAVLSTSVTPMTENASTTSVESTTSAMTTKKTTTAGSVGGKKKKKKNKKKNKKRRPGKKPAKLQSKISEDENSTSKLPNPTGISPTNRPLSTRIYNYLAREVMPNVGVGIVGLMLTAGLAGLLLYPFGAPVPIRRNYEKPNNPTYNNLNDYSPVTEVDNAQPEESVLSQVLAGMSNTINQFSREEPDVLYKTHPKYKPARFDNPNMFSHHKDVKFTTEKIRENVIKYSELGDVVAGPHESVKFTSFDINDSIKYPVDNIQPSPSYSTLDLTTSSQNEVATYHKHSDKSQDSVKPESVYSTLGEYASYNNPADLIQNPVYNDESYDYKNHKNKDTEEFKVSSELEVVTQVPENQTNLLTTMKITKHEQPSSAALEGIPKNYRTLQTSIRFEEPASVLPMNQDFVPSEGIYATSVEHGPRNMKLRRRKRNVSSENELDSVLVEVTTQKVHDTTNTTTTEMTVKFITISAENTNWLHDTNTTSTISNSSGISEEIVNIKEVEVEINSNQKTFNVSTTALSGSSSESSTIHTYSYPSTSSGLKDESSLNGTYMPCENCDILDGEEHSPTSPFSLGTLFRKVLDFKLRIGLELIRATSEVIGKYLGTVQAKMSEALRNIQRSAFRTNLETTGQKITKRRDKRHIILRS